jgi:hypothetical protein
LRAGLGGFVVFHIERIGAGVRSAPKFLKFLTVGGGEDGICGMLTAW